MNIFKRFMKIGESEAHAAADNLENPIKMTEQGIRDLKKKLDDSLKAYAEVKAMAIKSRREYNEQKQRADNYEQKAMQLVEKGEKGQIETQEADRLATEALERKKEAMEQAEVTKKNADNLDARLNDLDGKIKKLRSNISHYENELKTLKARQKVSQATKTVNKQMSNVDTSSTASMLERMKEKVDKEEALADAYGEMADSNKSLDDEIDSALEESSGGGSEDLAALKEKMKKNKDQ